MEFFIIPYLINELISMHRILYRRENHNWTRLNMEIQDIFVCLNHILEVLHCENQF